MSSRTLKIMTITFMLFLTGCGKATVPAIQAPSVLTDTPLPTQTTLPPTVTSSSTSIPVPTSTSTPTPTHTQKPTSTFTPTAFPALTGNGGGVIAFTAISASNERSSEIELMNADGSGLQALPNSGGGASGWAPAWSPDGKWIAYIVHQNDNNWPMYIIRSDGSNRQQVLTGDLYHFPAWSPDGTQIACSRNGNMWIMHISLDGDTANITDQRQLTFLDRQYASVSSWSPDGQQIVFVSQMGDARGTASYDDPNSSEIYMINIDGTGLHKLTENDVSDSEPDWSPFSNQIVFTSARDGDYEIYSMNTDGSNIQQLTDNPASDDCPAWSPDGTQIAFVSNRDGNNEIYIMDSDGSNQTRLTDTPTLDFLPTWRPERSLSISTDDLTAIVPLGNPTALDGLFSPGEWERGLRQEFTDGGEVFLMQSNDYLYLGVHENFDDLTVTSVCLEHENEISIFHSSGSLGTAIFAPVENGWQLTQPFKWGLYGVTSNTTSAERQRQAYLAANGWLSNLGSMTETEEIEYQIAIPGGSFRLAVAYLRPPDYSQVAWWPSGLAGDCRKVELLQGNVGENLATPLLMQFSPETWVTFTTR